MSTRCVLLATAALTANSGTLTSALAQAKQADFLFVLKGDELGFDVKVLEGTMPAGVLFREHQDGRERCRRRSAEQEAEDRRRTDRASSTCAPSDPVAAATRHSRSNPTFAAARSRLRASPGRLPGATAPHFDGQSCLHLQGAGHAGF